ncbi:PREDICTED: cyclin-dependent kinase 2-interacting protein [Condylura cristata]|uniref:cyclin-dependent kinase 2-interacting protein n=1 Tax=Condylura cristata TaxID=143302 RepID=UPI0006434F29|nr:PREDICTED: cyclin-dependent kinase 2-interacting protein [Condylura cristata]
MAGSLGRVPAAGAVVTRHQGAWGSKQRRHGPPGPSRESGQGGATRQCRVRAAPAWTALSADKAGACEKPPLRRKRLAGDVLGPGLAKTPRSATPRKPVLSVSARKIKDNAADWHNLILKWETLNDAGFATASSIANLRINLSSKDEIELEGSSPACGDNAEKMLPEYSPELETLCEELRATLDGLTKIQMKMEKLSSTTKGICELENYHCGEESRRPPLFHTWPTAHFYEVSRRLSDMYGRELRLKRAITDELAHTEARGLALCYLSMWLHQPYVQSDSKLQLESLLLETGHRPL